jgi:hypothetical protein
MSPPNSKFYLKVTKVLKSNGSVVDSHYLPLEFIMQEEIWKDIKGYEGLYQVSSYGRVKSLCRIDSNNHIVKEKYLKQKGGEYPRVVLSKNGKIKQFLTHRLVCIAFIPNIQQKKCVNHIDEDKKNNNVDNLEWVTYSENQNHGTKNKRCSEKMKNHTAISKRVLQMDLNFNKIKEWPSTKEVERELGFHNSNISRACLGVRPTAFGFKWRYIDV